MPPAARFKKLPNRSTARALTGKRHGMEGWMDRWMGIPGPGLGAGRARGGCGAGPFPSSRKKHSVFIVLVKPFGVFWQDPEGLASQGSIPKDFL